MAELARFTEGPKLLEDFWKILFFQSVYLPDLQTSTPTTLRNYHRSRRILEFEVHLTSGILYLEKGSIKGKKMPIDRVMQKFQLKQYV